MNYNLQDYNNIIRHFYKYKDSLFINESLIKELKPECILNNSFYVKKNDNIPFYLLFYHIKENIYTVDLTYNENNLTALLYPYFLQKFFKNYPYSKITYSVFMNNQKSVINSIKNSGGIIIEKAFLISIENPFYNPDRPQIDISELQYEIKEIENITNKKCYLDIVFKKNIIIDHKKNINLLIELLKISNFKYVYVWTNKPTMLMNEYKFKRIYEIEIIADLFYRTKISQYNFEKKVKNLNIINNIKDLKL